MIEVNCKSVLGGWQTQVTATGYLFGPVFNACGDLWQWQRENLFTMRGVQAFGVQA